MKRTILYLAAFLLGFTTILEAATKTRTLGSMQVIYGNELNKIQSSHLEKSVSWMDEYKKSLLMLRTKMQTTKNLDGWVIVDNEIKRFEKNKTITEEDLQDNSSELKTIQSKYLNVPSGIEAQKNEDILNLRNLYCYHLKNMQDDLTGKGNIPEALRIRVEIEKARNSKEVQEAELAVEEQEMEEEVIAMVDAPAEPVVVETNQAGDVTDDQIKKWLELRADYIEKLKISYEDFNSKQKKQESIIARKRWNRVLGECRNTVAQEKPTDSESLKKVKKAYRDAALKTHESREAFYKAKEDKAEESVVRPIYKTWRDMQKDLKIIIPQLEDAIGWEKIPGSE